MEIAFALTHQFPQLGIGKLDERLHDCQWEGWSNLIVKAEITIDEVVRYLQTYFDTNWNIRAEYRVIASPTTMFLYRGDRLVGTAGISLLPAHEVDIYQAHYHGGEIGKAILMISII